MRLRAYYMQHSAYRVSVVCGNVNVVRIVCACIGRQRARGRTSKKGIGNISFCRYALCFAQQFCRLFPPTSLAIARARACSRFNYLSLSLSLSLSLPRHRTSSQLNDNTSYTHTERTNAPYTSEKGTGRMTRESCRLHDFHVL